MSSTEVRLAAPPPPTLAAAVSFTCTGQRVDIVAASRPRRGDDGCGRPEPARAGALPLPRERAIAHRVDHPDYLDALCDPIALHGVQLVVPLADLDHGVLASALAAELRVDLRGSCGVVVSFRQLTLSWS